MNTTSTDAASLITTPQGEPDFDAARIPGVRLVRAEQACPRSPAFYEPHVRVLVQGQKIGFFGDETCHHDAERYLMMSVPLSFEYEIHASAAEPLPGVNADVEIGTLKELLLQMEETFGSDGDNELAPSTSMTSVLLDAGMVDAVIRLLRCLQNLLDNCILDPQLVREIISHALRSGQGDILRAVTGRHSGYGCIARILRRIHADCASALDIDILARETNMSVSAFRHNFKAMTFTSPLQYPKGVHLHKTWNLMVQDGLNASTTANQVGYESPSQFSREFRRHFGRTPSEEVQVAYRQPAGSGVLAIHTDVRIFDFPYTREGSTVSSPAEVFKCLAGETRARTILLIVDQGKLCVYEPTCVLVDSQPEVSRHLAQLCSARLLLDRRRGQRVYCRLSPALPARIHETLQATLRVNDGWLQTNVTRLRDMDGCPQRASVCC